MYMRRPAQMIGLGLSCLLFTGCFGNPAEKAMEDAIEQETGGEAQVDMDGDSMRIETDEGVFTTGQELQADWPKDVPVYPGAEVQFSAMMNEDADAPGAGAMFTTSDGVEKVVAYYKAELEANGWTISATMGNAGSSFLGATKGEQVVSVAVAQVDGQTSITIGIGKE
jgi:hypothetical protein